MPLQGSVLQTIWRLIVGPGRVGINHREALLRSLLGLGANLFEPPIARSIQATGAHLLCSKQNVLP